MRPSDYTSSLFDELTKIAFDEEDAGRVLKMVKQRQLPKASKRLFPEGYETPLAAIPPKDAMLDSREQWDKAIGIPPAPRAQLSAEFDEDAAHSPPLRIAATPGFKGAIYSRSRPEVDLKRIADEQGIPATLPAPEHRKMLHAIVKGHELDELTTPSAPSSRSIGHMSPDVLLKEHNRTVTLPPGYEDVRGFMSAFRNHVAPHRLPELNVFSRFGYRFGEGPRLSRHARRRMVESLDRQFTANAASDSRPDATLGDRPDQLGGHPRRVPPEEFPMMSAPALAESSRRQIKINRLRQALAARGAQHPLLQPQR